MKCDCCFKNEGIFKIRIYEDVLKNGMHEDILLNTSFICEDCLNKKKFKFNII